LPVEEQRVKALKREAKELRHTYETLNEAAELFA
jgi:hypothetical protein